mmetsp:Transcript_6605/g.4764  ORF Transcript_6605/g.4764 Transcript_6605/m.4764 type:complete len:159 (-) Transcript_6605:493-969(-)
MKALDLTPLEYDRDQVKISFKDEFRTLMWRSRIYTAKEPRVVRARVGQGIILGLLVGLVFSNVNVGQREDINQLYDVLGMFSLISGNCVILNFQAASAGMLIEALLVKKEFSDNKYSVLSFFLTKNIIELPVIILQSLFYLTLVVCFVNIAETAALFF